MADSTARRLKLAALATTGFVVVEFVTGWLANSLALVSDAGHNLTDAVALLLTLWALGLSARPANHLRTFGYHRAGVLAALANALSLVGLAAYIGYEGFQRFQHPEPVASLPMIVMAGVGLILNTSIVLALRTPGHTDLNVRSAVVHMLGDALSSVGVLAAGIAVRMTGSMVWDPLVSVVIAVFILWSSWSIIQQSLHILLESSPTGVTVADLVRDVEGVPGVESVHDVHVWSLSASVHALSAHVVIRNPTTVAYGEIQDIVHRVKDVLASKHSIAHATLETHCADDPDTSHLHCVIAAGHEAGHKH